MHVGMQNGMRADGTSTSACIEIWCHDAVASLRQAQFLILGCFRWPLSIASASGDSHPLPVNSPPI